MTAAAAYGYTAVREGKLSRADHRTFVDLVETWRQSGAPERTRT